MNYYFIAKSTKLLFKALNRQSEISIYMRIPGKRIQQVHFIIKKIKSISFVLI